MLDHYLHTARAAAAAITPTRNLLEVEPAAPGVTTLRFTDSGRAAAWLKAEHQVLMRAIAYAADNGFDVHAWQLPWALTDSCTGAATGPTSLPASGPPWQPPCGWGTSSRRLTHTATSDVPVFSSRISTARSIT